MADWSSRFRKLDFYPKLLDDCKEQTFSGATVSIVAFLFMVMLLLSELSLYLSVETVHHLTVDTTRGEKLRINFDVSFPKIPCSLLTVDAMDVSGNHQLSVEHDIKKRRINPSGVEQKEEESHAMDVSSKREQQKKAKEIAEKMTDPRYCGSCYGAQSSTNPSECCNTCDQVQELYKKKGWQLPALSTIEQCYELSQGENNLVDLKNGEGCRMYGNLQVNKVAGNFHFAPGKSFQEGNTHIHDLSDYDATAFDVSHTIHSIMFGEVYPGLLNPLDKTQKTMTAGGGMVMYYTKVVPTTFAYINGDVVKTNQFSVTEHTKKADSSEGQQSLPGVFFFYELSPIMVKFEQTRQKFLHFLTQLCAIIGGVFTVAGMIDKVVWTSYKAYKKVELGKHS